MHFVFRAASYQQLEIALSCVPARCQDNTNLDTFGASRLGVEAKRT